MKAEGRKQKAEGRSAGRSNRVFVALVITAAVFLLPSALFACSVCMGDPTSSMNTGARNGILFLLAVIGLVQVGFIALFWSFWKRAKAMRARREQLQVIEGGAH